MNHAYYWYRPHPIFGCFFPGKTLNLITNHQIYVRNYIDISQLGLAKKYFPDGLSPHGLQILLTKFSKKSPSSIGRG